MTLKSDLIAAKALIDTQEELYRLGIVGAISSVTSGVRDRAAALDALRRFAPGRLHVLTEVMSSFDRAIAAAPDDEVA